MRSISTPLMMTGGGAGCFVESMTVVSPVFFVLIS